MVFMAKRMRIISNFAYWNLEICHMLSVKNKHIVYKGSYIFKYENKNVWNIIKLKYSHNIIEHCLSGEGWYQASL